MLVKLFKTALLTGTFVTGLAHAEDIVRLGNLKFAHFGAVSYMKEIAPKYGVKIEERIFAKGADIMPAIVSGDIDVSASGSDAAIAARAAGVPIYVVAGFSRGGARIVAAPELKARHMTDLKGKRIGVSRGGAQELMLLAELAKNGMTWSDKPGKDVQIVYLGFADLNQALASKQIDAICQSEPQSTEAIRKGFGMEVIKPYDTPIGKSVRSLVMTEKMYKENPVLAQKVLRIFVEATTKFLSSPTLAENYVRNNLFKSQLTSEDYRTSMENAEFTYDITTAEIQNMTDMMKQFGMGRMTSPPKAEEWVKLDMLQKAKAELKAK
jgi:NitT/TauT family transport system substrate-binding protein